MLTGKPDAGNLHVRFDEGEQRDWRKPPVALYSTGQIFFHHRSHRWTQILRTQATFFLSSDEEIARRVPSLAKLQLC